MKAKILALGLVCLFLIFLLADEKDVLSSFESIVSKIDEFVSASPVGLISRKQERFSPSGKINYLLKFEIVGLAYDIQKTNSLVTPYTGYIVVSLKVQSNAMYGDVKYGDVRSKNLAPDKRVEYNWGFQYAEDAEKVKKFASCTLRSKYSEGSRCRGDVKLLYAYQRGNWVFKKVNAEGSNRIRSGTVRGDIEKIILENPEWQGTVRKFRGGIK